MAKTQKSRVPLQWTTVCIDCADAEEMAEFYGRLLGWEISARDAPPTREGGAGWILMRDPAGGVGLSFQAEEWYRPPVWPETPGTPSKMLHFDFGAEDLEAAVSHAVAAGASVAPHQPADRAKDELRVMLDPAGHPFCLSR
ncbi:MAG: VOC family protein [Anaerolineaceae bacterium]